MLNNQCYTHLDLFLVIRPHRCIFTIFQYLLYRLHGSPYHNPSLFVMKNINYSYVVQTQQHFEHSCSETETWCLSSFCGTLWVSISSSGKQRVNTNLNILSTGMVCFSLGVIQSTLSVFACVFAWETNIHYC